MSTAALAFVDVLFTDDKMARYNTSGTKVSTGWTAEN